MADQTIIVTGEILGLITGPEKHKIAYEANGDVKVAMNILTDLAEKKAFSYAKEIAFEAWCASCDLYDLSVNPNCLEDFEKWWSER